MQTNSVDKEIVFLCTLRYLKPAKTAVSPRSLPPGTLRRERRLRLSDDPKSVRNLVRSYCYCCSLAIGYERQTIDRRLQRSNANAMNLLQKRISRKHLSFASARSQYTKLNQNSTRRNIKSNKFLCRYPKSNLGSYDWRHANKTPEIHSSVGFIWPLVRVPV